MLARRLIVLLAVFWATPCWSDADPGQAEPTAAEHALLPIDEAAFEIAVSTGGFYYFWQPGEFARLDAQDSSTLFVSGGQTVEQIDGQLQGRLVLPFEVEAGDAEITVRVGLQSVGEIELYPPGATATYPGNATARTSHMLVTRVAEPTPGTWNVHLAGSGVYLVNVTARRGDDALAMAEPVVGHARPEHGLAEHGPGDLMRFRDASPEDRWDDFRRLPTARRQNLARALLDDTDPTVAYVAAGSLAREGALEEAIPVFARILVRGEDETALHGRMGYDWIHDDDPALAGRIIRELRAHLREHLDDYAPSERSRAETFLRE